LPADDLAVGAAEGDGDLPERAGDDVGVAPACGSGPVSTVTAITTPTISSALAMTPTANTVRLEVPCLLITHVPTVGLLSSDGGGRSERHLLRPDRVMPIAMSAFDRCHMVGQG
jgi:hypothetical protein